MWLMLLAALIKSWGLEVSFPNDLVLKCSWTLSVKRVTPATVQLSRPVWDSQCYLGMFRDVV